MGSSESGGWVLGAAAETGAVAAVAAWEPPVVSVAREEELAYVAGAIEQTVMAAADGRLVDAVHAAIPASCADDEIAALEEIDFFERWASGVPAMLQMLQQGQAYEGPMPTDPEVLAKITVPVLLMVGEETRLDVFANSVQHVAQHVADPHVRELPGLGHFAPVLAPEPIAEELTTFFERIP